MKICWDNLENLRYSCKSGHWYSKSNKSERYKYVDFCKICGEPFLSTGHSFGLYCSNSCARKDISKEDRKKRSIDSLGNKNRNWKGGVRSKKLPLYDTYASQISFCEETRRNPEDHNILQVKCLKCKQWFTPSWYSVQGRIAVINGKSRGDRRFYCSQRCKDECPIFNQKKYSKEELEKASVYQTEVRKLSNINFSKYYYLINSQNLKRSRNGSTGYVLDHIYSVAKGFENNIPSEIIASPINLRLILAEKNLIKSSRCLFTKEQLYELYHQFIKEGESIE